MDHHSAARGARPRRGHVGVLPALGALALISLAACATGTQVPPTPSSRPTARATHSATGTPQAGLIPGPPLPACAGDRQPVAMPEGFPEEVPFPPGTVITRARITEAGGAYVEGYAPLTLIEAARFYIAQIPAAGYVHGEGDSEAHEAESTFSGNGIRGHWLVASVDNCPDAAALSIVTAEMP